MPTAPRTFPWYHCWWLLGCSISALTIGNVWRENSTKTGNVTKWCAINSIQAKANMKRMSGALITLSHCHGSTKAVILCYPQAQWCNSSCYDRCAQSGCCFPAQVFSHQLPNQHAIFFSDFKNIKRFQKLTFHGWYVLFYQKKKFKNSKRQEMFQIFWEYFIFIVKCWKLINRGIFAV